MTIANNIASGLNGVDIKPVHTLNARDHVFFEVLRDYFSLNPTQMLTQIQALRAETEKALQAKGVSYSALRSALTPQQDRREAAFIFDTLQINNSWYGLPVFQRLIPLLNRASNQSILVGDCLDRPLGQIELEAAMRDVLVQARPFAFQHSTQYYVVYLNNLTAEQMFNIDQGLKGWDPYIGYADTTYGSMFKHLLSTMLVNMCLQHKGVVIQGHEDDVSDTENYNMCGYPFEENGYRCVSVQEIKMGTLLSFKIERPVFPGFETDTELSLNAVTASPSSLADFRVDVQEAKVKYLQSEKTGSLQRAALENSSATELSRIIEERIASTYIYNLAHLAQHNVTKFNVMVELSGKARTPTRLMAALAYESEARRLRLITLY